TGSVAAFRRKRPPIFPAHCASSCCSSICRRKRHRSVTLPARMSPKMMADSDSPLPLTARLIGENDLSAHDRQNIRRLLIAAYPQYAELWSLRDFWGGPAEYRLLLLDLRGRLLDREKQ